MNMWELILTSVTQSTKLASKVRSDHLPLQLSLNNNNIRTCLACKIS